MPRLQAIVVRNGRVLMVKHRHGADEWWCLPGGGQEANETPENGVLRELREECRVDGVVIRQTCHVSYSNDDEAYSFLVEIGDQKPSLGHDPEVAEGKQPFALADMQWLRLSEIPERDRTFLWTAGLLGVDDFLSEVKSWGSDPSYPGEEHANRSARGPG